MILLPKKANAVSMWDYKPISLIHIIGKLFSNVLASRLAPHLNNLVSVNQSTFVKGHYIQDNFWLVQSWYPQGRHREGFWFGLLAIFVWYPQAWGVPDGLAWLGCGTPLISKHSRAPQQHDWSQDLPCEGALIGGPLIDEDINTSATIIHSIEILGPITQSRAQQLNH
jgi:hypothetical protein